MAHEHFHHVPTSSRLKIAGLVLAVAALVVAAIGIWVRVEHAGVLEKEVESRHVTVKLVTPQFGPATRTLILPGNVSADLDATIYARVNGYLKAWYTDIGAHVRKGQLLGEIETPELDQQILRAQADVATAESNWEIADISAKRWQNLVGSESVSRQEADEKTAAEKSSRDMLAAARANLKSLLADQSFRRIVAPFDGLVTERNTDVGKLINTGSNNGQALFRVVDNRRLRIYTEVPQDSAYLIKPKMKAQIFFPELPGQGFAATVLSTASAIRESSRTATVELLMENQDGRFFSGSYVEVHFVLPSDSNVYRLPVSTLLFRREGLQVATVDDENRVVLKSIVVVRDLGREVEVGSGIDGRDRVINSPSDSISQGDIVRIQNAGAQPEKRQEAGAS